LGDGWVCIYRVQVLDLLAACDLLDDFLLGLYATFVGSLISHVAELVITSQTIVDALILTLLEGLLYLLEGFGCCLALEFCQYFATILLIEEKKR